MPIAPAPRPRFITALLTRSREPAKVRAVTCKPLQRRSSFFAPSALLPQRPHDACLYWDFVGAAGEFNTFLTLSLLMHRTRSMLDQYRHLDADHAARAIWRRQLRDMIRQDDSQGILQALQCCKPLRRSWKEVEALHLCLVSGAATARKLDAVEELKDMALMDKFWDLVDQPEVVESWGRQLPREAIADWQGIKDDFEHARALYLDAQALRMRASAHPEDARLVAAFR